MTLDAQDTPGPGSTAAPPTGETVRRELRFDPDGRIAEDLPCRGCGYNLRGHAGNALCPECSTPVSRSIQQDLLRLADPNWVQRLAKGMRLVIIGLLAATVVQVGAGVTSSVLVSQGFAVVTTFVGAAALVTAGLSGVVVIGVWLLTTPDPGRGDLEPAVGARNVARWCQVAQIAAAPLQLADPAAGGGLGGTTAPVGGLRLALTTAGVALWIVVLVGHTAGLVYLRRLALRLPNPSLARQTMIVMWGYLVSQLLAVTVSVIYLLAFMSTYGAGGTAQPSGILLVVGIGGCAVLIGTLIFGIWALVLLFRYAAAFNRAAHEARVAWRAPSYVAGHERARPRE